MATNSKNHGYLSSTKNIVGCALAAGGPVLALTGVVAPPVGLVLAPVLYAIGALAAPNRKHVNVVAGVDPADVTRSLAQIQRKTMGRVPSQKEIMQAVVPYMVRHTATHLGWRVRIRLGMQA